MLFFSHLHFTPTRMDVMCFINGKILALNVFVITLNSRIFMKWGKVAKINGLFE